MAEVLHREGNKVRFKVVVGTEEVRDAFEGVYHALAQQVRVPGFRPGKAPRNVLEKRVGKDFVISEVREQLLKFAYPKAVRELELAPVSANVTPGELSPNTPFEFTVDAETYPNVELPSWQEFKLEAVAPEVQDEDASKALETLRIRQANYVTVDRPSATTDLVTVEILSGEEQGKTHSVYLERVEDHVRAVLEGKRAGDEVNVPTGPEADADTVATRLLEVKEQKLPDLDDELAKIYNATTLEELKKAVRDDLELRAHQVGLQTKREEFLNKLAEQTKVEIPKALIDRQRESMERDIENDLRAQKLTFAEYRKYLEGEGKLSEFEDNLTQSAQIRVLRDLALEKLTEQLGTQLNEDEWRTALENYARQQRVSVARLRELMGEGGLENLKIIVTREKAVEEALAKLGVQ